MAGFVYQKRYGYPVIASVRIGPPAEMSRAYAVPYWALITATALPSVAWFRTVRRRRRASRAGLCAVCGYDLRASPGRCPECGASTAAGDER